jgi:predicted ABC-type ATPase
MFNVCPNCGEYTVEKQIDPSGPFAICPHCHYTHSFFQQPLFIISGASGTGKTTVCLSLISKLNECVVLEQDILWGIVPATSEDNYSSYRNVWLRIAKNVGQAGRPVVLCGTALPEQFEECPERLYFTTLHYLTFVCDDDLLVERLKQRPEWRQTHSPEFLEDMVQFNRWLKANASLTKPPMTLCDTSHRNIDETVEYVAKWVREHL